MADRTILIAGGGTGGHLMPALAIADALKAAGGYHVVLVGAERGIEASLLPGRGYPFHLLPAEPFYRRQWWKNLRWPFVAWGLFRAADRLLEELRPAMVVGTGGYAAGPVVWRAARRGIPTAIQEQNAHPGLASRLLAPRVNEIWISVPETLRALRPGPRTRVLELGSPIFPPDPGRRPAALARFGLDPDRPVILITGGSQGALGLNERVAAWLETGGADGLQLLWSAGKGTVERFRRFHHPPEHQVLDFINPMADAWSVTTLAISRAGMTTIAELSAWGIPSILVPLPTAAEDHQTANARVMAEAGAAVLIPQSELDGARLGETVRSLLEAPARLAEMSTAARRRGHPDAAARIVERIGVYSG